MFRRTLLLTFVVLALTVSASDSRKTSSSRSRGSGRGSTSRRTNYNPQPAPTSFSNPAPAKEPTLFGWQTKAKETPVRSSQTGVSHQSRAAQPSHSYPSSQTGLSGNQQPPSYQQAVQQSHTYPQNNKPQQAHTYPQSNANPGQSNPSYPGQSNPSQAHAYPVQNNPSPAHTYPAQTNPSQTNTYQSNAKPSNSQSHAYPASGGLSGHSGVGGNYPAQPGGGLSGASAPTYQGGQPARPPVSNTYPVGGAAGGYGNNYRPPAQGPPPAYPGNSNLGYGSPSYGHPSYGHSGGFGGGYGGHGGGYGGPGGFGGYNYNYGGMNRGMSTLTKVGIAGAGVSTLLTGLALWNLARSGNRGNTYIYQDHRGNPVPVPADSNAPVSDPILGELVNCTLTISGANNTEVIGIPCAIATSFSHNSDLSTGVDKSGATEEAKCTITVVTKNATEFSTTIPCSIFLNTAKEANVTEPPPLAVNGTDLGPGMEGAPPVGLNGTEGVMPVQLGPMPLAPVPLSPMPGDPALQQPMASNNSYPVLNPNLHPTCKLDPGVIPDPLNPCTPALGDLSVVPLGTSNATSETSAAAA